jgi:hypothetical protein
MYTVIRKFPNMQNVEEVARRAATGLGPIMKQQPGFKGYYVVQFEGGGGGSISLFESADAARAAHQLALSWIKESVADQTGGEPEVTMGKVLVQVTAE